MYSYAADDPGTGRVEREYDHVLVGHVAADHAMAPDPAEVDAVRWVAPADLTREIAADPARFAPWLSGVLALLPDD